MSDQQVARLEFLVGEWRSTNASYPDASGPGGTSQGKASYTWGIGGTWLLFSFHSDLPGLGRYQVDGGVSYEKEAKLYKAYSANSLGNLLVYEGTWETEDRLAFSLVYPKVQPDTRVSYTSLPDGSVRMTSERPAEGGGREIYFETLLERSN